MSPASNAPGIASWRRTITTSMAAVECKAIRQVVAEHRIAPESMLEPERRVQEWIVLPLRRSRSKPPETAERAQPEL